MRIKKEWYICVFAFIIIFVSVGFIVANKSSENNADIEYIEYESFAAAPQTDTTKKEDYQKTDLEIRLQDTIQLMVEGSNPLVNIQNFNVADNTETTVSVTLYVNQDNSISEELRESIENLVLKSMNGMPRENVTINIKNAEK